MERALEKGYDVLRRDAEARQHGELVPLLAPADPQVIHQSASRRKRKAASKVAQGPAPNLMPPEDRERYQNARKRLKQAAAQNQVAVAIQDGLEMHPQESLEEYALAAEKRAYMADLLRKRETGHNAASMKEEALIAGLPPLTKNLAYLDGLGDRARFHQLTINQVVFEDGLSIPDTVVVTKEYIDEFLCEPIRGRDRPCLLGTECFALKRYHFSLREFPMPTEYRAFCAAWEIDRESALHVYSMHYPCVICELRDWNEEHLRRANHRNDRDPRYMEDGRVQEPGELYKLINRWQVSVGVPGQYNIYQCLGLGDTTYTGLSGPIPKFDPKDFVPMQRRAFNPVTQMHQQQRYLHQSDGLLFGDGAELGAKQNVDASSHSIPTGSA